MRLKLIPLILLSFIGCRDGYMSRNNTVTSNSESPTTTSTTTSSTTSTSSSSSSSSTTTTSSTTSTTYAGPQTNFDRKRCETLRIIDQKIKVAPVTPGNYNYLQPQCPECMGQYISKSIVIRGLIDECGENISRLNEANAVLRQAYTVKFVAKADCSNVNVQTRWQHGRRTTALKDLIWYGHTYAPDVMNAVRKYAECHLEGPQTNSSENLKWGANSGRILSHEFLNQTNTSTYAELKTWAIDALKRQLQFGFSEWGSNYNSATAHPILNLAELSRDPEIKKWALAVYDYYIALQGVHSIGAKFATGRIRTYKAGWAKESPVQSTLGSFLWESPNPDDWSVYAENISTLVLGNYRPLKAHESLYIKNEDYQAKHKSTKKSHYFYSHKKYAVGTLQNTKSDYFIKTLETHDVFPVFIQTQRSRHSFVVPFGQPIDKTGPSKAIEWDNRSFGVENVAFSHLGGDTKGVWTGGGVKNVPIRLFYGKDIQANVIIQDGWAFLTDGQGVYIAWAPTIGDPVNSGEVYKHSNQIWGRFLRSSHSGSQGETSIVEVGDDRTYTSFEAFRSDILNRNPRPRVNNNIVRYTTKSGKVIEWKDNAITINGQVQDPETYPYNESPYLNGLKLTIGGRTIEWNVQNGNITGQTERIPTNLRFGTLN